MTHWTSNLRIPSRTGSNPIRSKPLISLSKKLYTHFSLLVGSRNGFKSLFYKLTAFYTIELNENQYKLTFQHFKPEDCLEKKMLVIYHDLFFFIFVLLFATTLLMLSTNLLEKRSRNFICKRLNV